MCDRLMVTGELDLFTLHSLVELNNLTVRPSHSQSGRIQNIFNQRVVDN